MFSRSNLLIIAIAIAGALLGLWAGSYFNQPHVAGMPAGAGVLAPGDALADLQLRGTDGATHRLGDWHGKLVLVNFWATWCGPCRAVAPVIEKLAEDYAGKVKVVKLDTDANQATAMRFNIRSIPTILLFKDGQVVDGVIGADPRLRGILDAKIAKLAA